MPWHLENRDGKVCVIKDSDGSVAGCHGSRADAIKQQRALYANESRMASIYDELDAQPVEEIPVSRPPVPDTPMSGFAAELAALVLNDQRERSLTASIAQSMETMAEQQRRADEERQALVAALSKVGQPIINVPAPEITVQAAEVHVPPTQVTVQPPEVTVTPEIHVDAPQVTVRPEIDVHMPPARKEVTFERDPLTNQITKAEVTES